jgi:hypothetical protein
MSFWRVFGDARGRCGDDITARKDDKRRLKDDQSRLDDDRRQCEPLETVLSSQFLVFSLSTDFTDFFNFIRFKLGLIWVHDWVENSVKSFGDKWLCVKLASFGFFFSHGLTQICTDEFR